MATYIYRPREGIMLNEVKVLNVENPDRAVIVSSCQPFGSTEIYNQIANSELMYRILKDINSESTESYLGS
jgi:hypothetical protein